MKEILRLALTNINSQEKRAWLTIIGIFIGIAAVVSLVSLGQGLEAAIDEQFEALGSDKIIIQSSANTFGVAGDDVADPLTEDDLQAAEQVRGVDQATYMNFRTAEITVGDESNYYFVMGADTGEGYELAQAFWTVDLAEGRHLRRGDRYSAVVGADYSRRAVFDDPVRPGDRIEINDKRFGVVGVLDPIGNAQDDRSLMIPRDAMDELFDLQEVADIIVLQTSPGEDPGAIAQEVERTLRRERGLDEGNEDFTVQTPEDLLESFNTILTIIQIVLIGIAGISLLVGGINIMNAMYTSVLERTKEIGIMKAIGATPKTIQAIFLIESGALGLLGGAIGVAVGLAIAKGVEYIGRAALNTDFLSAYISWWLILGALAFAMVVGMISGWFPARSAAAQDPVESLRYE